MDNVQPLHAETGENPTRRRFQTGAIYGMMTAISAALGLPALAYLLVPGKVRKKDDWIEVGDLTRLSVGSPVELTFRRNRVDGWKVISEKSTAWVVKTSDTEVTAFGPQCTHLGCAYHWEPDKKDFLCPCHTSVFSIDGKVTAGPAPRPLDRYQTKIEGSKLLLGKLEQVSDSGDEGMKKYLQGLNEWLDHRTGVHSAVHHFLYEEIPASSGWHQVFGSVAMFLFMVQAFTGIMLAFNYAPTPGEAYNSLHYILTEVTAGRLMRGLHHWGASMIIVVVVLHMIQVFLWGAYKKPREATWMVGVVLLLVTLAYGLTGYLLPWDNRAYWGTVVTTQIAAMAPGLGQYMTRLLGSSGSVGVVTFARFYGVHVLLLPPASMLLIGIHVYLVRRHGVAPAPGDEARPKKKFYPEQVFKDTVAIFFAFALLFTLAIAARVPLEQLADPTDTAYIPRPEWYFLFLFQTLKVFEGPLEVVGAVVLPGLAVLTLILVPFLDRGQVMRVTRRTTAIAIVLFAAIGWAGLTTAAVMSTPKEASASVDYSQPTDWMQLSPEEMAGVAYFRQEQCVSCHAVGDEGTAIGPDLTKGNIRRDAAWMIQHFKQPGAMRPGSSMPPIELSDAQLSSLAAFLLKLNDRNATALENAPEFATQGSLIYQANHCGACHMVNGVGMKVGPVLNGLSRRQSRSWVIDHFMDPQKLAPGTMMPPYKLPQKDLDTLTTYLFALPEVQ